MAITTTDHGVSSWGAMHIVTRAVIVDNTLQSLTPLAAYVSLALAQAHAQSLGRQQVED